MSAGVSLQCKPFNIGKRKCILVMLNIFPLITLSSPYVTVRLIPDVNIKKQFIDKVHNLNSM